VNLRTAERTELGIAVDEGRIAPGAALRGRVANPPPGAIEVSLVATTTTPFEARSEIVTAIETHDPGFQLAAPWAPTSWRGELLTTEWAVHARTSAGATAATPFEIRANRVTVESCDDDDLGAPPRPFDVRLPAIAGTGLVASLVGVVTAFGTGHAALRYLAGFGVFFAIVALTRAAGLALQWAVLGDVRCRVEPVGDQLRCLVTTRAEGGLPAGADVRASLMIAELVSRSGPGRGPTEHEHVVLEHEVSLARAGDGTWGAAIPLTVANRAPLSRAGGDGSTTWSVSWVVRITIDAPRTPRFTRVMPLVAVPTGIDPSLHPRFVEIPRSAR
jgi:hypothetical protein